MATDAELADADAVSTQVIRLVRLVERVQAAKSATAPDTVERATYHLLVELVKGGPQRAGALAEAVHSDPSTISRQIAHLCKLGWVERTADPEDGRASLLAATDEGARVFERNRASRNEHFAAMLSGWTAVDRAALAQLLERFADDFEQFKTRASMPLDAGKASSMNASALPAGLAPKAPGVTAMNASALPDGLAPKAPGVTA